MPKHTEKKCEVRTIKHVYSNDEKLTIGNELAHAHEKLGQIEAEFDEVKASFKAKTTEQEAKVGVLATNLRNGYDMRSARVWVTMIPKTGKKEWRLETDDSDCLPVLIEDMQPEDYQAAMELAEREFEAKEEIQLFAPAGASSGILVVGRVRDRWYSAIRCNVAGEILSENLSTEGKSWKNRRDCVRQTAARFMAWVTDTHDADIAAGFASQVDDVVQSHKEREE